MLNELIQRIEIDVGQELARQISNRQAAFVQLYIQQVPAGGPCLSHAVVMRIQNPGDEFQQSLVAEPPGRVLRRLYDDS